MVKNVINHEEREHSMLSCSGSSRWWNCTPSAKLEAEYGEFSTSDFALEGTLAHELGQAYLQYDVLGETTKDVFDQQIDAIINHRLFSDEMFEEVPKYVEYCEQQFNEAKAKTQGAVMLVEQSVKLTGYVPGGKGSIDCTIIADETIEIIDLKYGKGVSVSAEKNKQLMLYALGVMLKYDLAYDFTQIVMTIVQPRRNNISSFTMTKADLYAWANDELKERAMIAFEGKGDLVVGEWCKFCNVKSRCTQIYKHNIELAKDDFREPSLLTDDEISDILLQVNMLIEWGNSVKDYALSLAINNGKKWPGFKLVEGTSRRKFANEEKVAEILLSQKDLSADDVYQTKLQGITNIQKVLGKKRFESLLSNYIIKPSGKPTLVDLTDKRPELGISQAQRDFADED